MKRSFREDEAEHPMEHEALLHTYYLISKLNHIGQSYYDLILALDRDGSYQDVARRNQTADDT